MTGLPIDPINSPEHLTDLIEKIRGALADIEAAGRGVHPSPDRIAAAPRVSDWGVARLPTTALTGVFEGHPSIADDASGWTSELFVLSPEQGFCRTLSRFYRLGMPLSEPVPSEQLN